MVYAIIVYDIEVDRIDKVRAILRRYLFWVQNSVFEGEISEPSLKALVGEIKQEIKADHDSVIFYLLKSERSAKRKVIGIEPGQKGFVL
jgi:CRISPR-associated protein Cas2